MAKELVRRDPFDFLAPWFDVGRRWDDAIRKHLDADRMIIPAVDIAEDENAITLHAELPGMRKDDVKITIEDGVLSLSGEKKFETEEKNKDFHRVERRYGNFHRSFTLPSGVDPDEAEAEFKDGVLTVLIPKSESAKPRQLKIK